MVLVATYSALKITEVAAPTGSEAPAPQASSASPVYRLHTQDPSPTEFPRQYTIFANTNHGDIEIMRQFQDTLRNFIRAGGTDVVVESDSVYQKIFDGVKSGQFRLQDFASSMDASSYLPADKLKEGQAIFQNIMQMALDNHIGFHAFDHAPAAMQKYPDVAQAVLASLTGHPEIIAEQLRDPTFKDRYTAYTTEFNAERDAVNPEVADNIKALGPQAKVLALYGSQHAPALAASLGLHNVQGIFVTAAGSAQDQQYNAIPLAQFPKAAPAPIPAATARTPSTTLHGPKL
jgi:hypothetical protein